MGVGRLREVRRPSRVEGLFITHKDSQLQESKRSRAQAASATVGAASQAQQVLSRKVRAFDS